MARRKGAAPKAAAKPSSTPVAAPAAPEVPPVEQPVVETKAYDDGTVATGVAPLPDQSPAEQDAQASDAAGDPPVPQALFGSSTFPSLIAIGDREVQLGDAVRGAYERMSVTVDVWNALSDAERDREIGDWVERERQAAAAVAKKADEAQNGRRFMPFDTLCTADQENPDKIEGEHLRKLGHRRGLSLSEMGRLSDDKVREQLRYIAYRQYER
jgi:hypothetical protein